jgi:hypothetical protein
MPVHAARPALDTMPLLATGKHVVSPVRLEQGEHPRPSAADFPEPSEPNSELFELKMGPPTRGDLHLE